MISKFFLHVSRKEQKKRFMERLEEPEKNWKFPPISLSYIPISAGEFTGRPGGGPSGGPGSATASFGSITTAASIALMLTMRRLCATSCVPFDLDAGSGNQSISPDVSAMLMSDAASALIRTKRTLACSSLVLDQDQSIGRHLV
jgi:hypothetical protein